jgi:hypothetical protein
MEPNRAFGVACGLVAMTLGATLALAPRSFQARVNAFYRCNPHLRFDLGWSEQGWFVAFTRFVGVAFFAIGAALAASLLAD